MAMQNLGGECVYLNGTRRLKNIPNRTSEVPFGDIKINKSSIIPQIRFALLPFHYLTFSIAGKRGVDDH
jgi:hypothetical protein